MMGLPYHTRCQVRGLERVTVVNIKYTLWLTSNADILAEREKNGMEAVFVLLYTSVSCDIPRTTALFVSERKIC